MDITRRRLFGIGQGLLAAAAVPGVFGAEAATSASDRLGRLARRDFAAQVNSDFTARRADGSRAWLKLISVEDMATSERKLETFALTFSGAGADLSQDTFELEHTALGRFP